MKDYNNTNFDFIELNKVYDDDGNTLLEKCILQKNHPKLRRYLFEKLKKNYKISKYFDYIKEGDM